MPSLLHEVLLELFRNRPALAPELLHEALNVKLPSHTEASIDSESLTQVQPSEYRADLVVRLKNGGTVLGISPPMRPRRTGLASPSISGAAICSHRSC